jgi:iron-sulfur cluster assembly accessory protein
VDSAQPCGYLLLQSSPLGGVVCAEGSATIRLMATVERETLVTLTEGAATKIKNLLVEEPEGEAGVLRIAVQGGGCSGFEYALGFDSGPQEGDHELDARGITIVVDPYSAPYIQGTEIDWVEGLQGGFAINNPNVKSSCGCGHSFQVDEGAAPEEYAAGGGCGSGCS